VVSFAPKGTPSGGGVLWLGVLSYSMDRVEALAGEAGVAVHLYEKAEIKAGRKIGHVNRVG